MSRSTADKPTPRERILETASRLFYAEGIRAVGIDRIILESDVAKRTFYHHFDSKNRLILTFIKKRDKDWQSWFSAQLEARRKDGPLAVFDAMADRLGHRDFRGCAFINTMVEMADFSSEIHQAAQAHKKAVIALIEDWLKGHGINGDIPALAYQFMLLIDGAIVATVRDGKAASALEAKKIAARLLEVSFQISTISKKRRPT